jgi:hypothetical protein
MPDTFEGLTNYLKVFRPKYLVKKNGEPIQERAAMVLAKKHGLPIFWIGNNCFLDESEAIEILRRNQAAARTPGQPGKARPLDPVLAPRRPGRPRKN